MAITANQAQGLVLALFGASAGGHLTSLSAASSVAGLAADLATSAGLILGKDLSSNTAFRDHVLSSSLKLTGAALTAAQSWMDGEFTKGTSRGDILATAVTYLEGLTDTSSVFYAAASSYRDTVKAAVTWSQGAGASTFGVSALRAQQGNTDVVAGNTFTLTTGTDTLIGTAGDDTFTGSATTFSTNDQIIDASSTDKDVYNLTVDAASAPKAINVETINITAASTAAAAVDAAGLAGVTSLTVTRSDLVISGATITGEKTVTVDNLNAAKVAAVTAGAGTKALNINQKTGTGITINGDTATDLVAVKGAATLNAGGTAKKVTITATVAADAATTASLLAENGKAVTVNAAKSVDIEVKNGGGGEKFTGAITVNAAAATEVAVENASGGVTVNATKGASRVDATGAAANGIVVAGIDDSGATFNLGTYAKKTNNVDTRGQISLDGTTGITDTAVVTAGGQLTINAAATAGNQIDNLTLASNGDAVVYELSADAGAATTKYTLSGANSVTVEADSAKFDKTTTVDATTAGTTTLKVTTLNTADLSKVAVDVIDVAAGATAKVLTLATGANVKLSADQTTSIELAGKNAGSSLTIATGDDTAASGATIDISVAELKLTNAAAVSIDATTGKLSATKLTAAADTVVTITGNKAVNLDSGNAAAASAAKQIDAANLTGALTIATATIKTITSGSAADKVTVNDGVVGGGSSPVAFTVATNAGNDTVVVTSAKDGSAFVTGEGNDTVTLSDNGAYVVDAGAGTDTVTIGDSKSTLIGGDGTDKLVIGAGAGAIDLSDNTNFAVSGFETIDIGATNDTVTILGSAITGQTFTLLGAGSNDKLLVKGTSSANTIDLSGVTQDTIAELQIQGLAGADTITGSKNDDLILGGAGADVMDGGDGTDTVSWTGTADDSAESGTQTGVVINMGATAVTAATISAKGVGVTADSVTSVAAGSAAYLYAAADANNSATVDTFSNVENAIGTDGKDYIVGSANANKITGGAGDDYILGGAGNDVFAFSASSNGNDTIGDLASGDQLDFKAFLGAGATVLAAGTGSNSTGDVDIAGGTANVAVVFNKASLASGDIVVAASHTAGKIAIADNGKAVVLVNSDADGAAIAADWLVYTVADTNAATGAQTWTVTLVGTLTYNSAIDTAAEMAAAAFFV